VLDLIEPAKFFVLVTRNPIVHLIAPSKIVDATTTNANIATTPMVCVSSKLPPSPRNNPPSAATRPIASVPQAPHTPCTEIAPTGSSMPMRSKNQTLPTTRMPAIAPMRRAAQGPTAALRHG
jgi:hypothetical protein